MTIINGKINFLVLVFVRFIVAFNYQSKIFSQRITHFENSYIDFNVKYYGDEGYPYMILKEPITPYNDLHLMLYVRLYDQPPNFLVSTPISLCQMLHDQHHKLNETLMQFNIPQIYNFAGKSCPIDQKIIRLSPYIFPSNFTTNIDLSCGYMNVESRLMKCSDELTSQNRNCETLLKTVTLVFLLNEACNSDEKDIPAWTGKQATLR